MANVMKTLIIILISTVMTTSCNSQKHSEIKSLKNDTVYTLWKATVYEVHGDSSAWTDYDISVNYELIQLLPVSVKTIIARYTAFFPLEAVENGEDLLLAQALGGFDSLEEARKKLLTDWKGEEIVSQYSNIIKLNLKQTEQSLFFVRYNYDYFPKGKCDEFRIDKNGHIHFVSNSEK